MKVYKRSWQRDETMIANQLLPIWGRARLSEITREDVQLFQADMLANGYKPGTVNRRMALEYQIHITRKDPVITFVNRNLEPYRADCMGKFFVPGLLGSRVIYPLTEPPLKGKISPWQMKKITARWSIPMTSCSGIPTATRKMPAVS